ncbi:hypothetical protein A2Y47_01390 [Candidatus Giovannonibacteria bacterium RIFCSPLOWO2_12_43_8]|uniref:FAD-binding FR-type domain-containing protein n=2 Tax=Candidatus Giovannoniibacteriota TaxID=1752738 RepID=A0A1F5WED2_9BACT|nr:MAG: hypothetical protein A2W57_02525 [Candidatus Giovannonibacteria bacterium RIFCSPHIGHO2_02_43_16]OGF94091.1 MAG: hypothetical protein A2Y47_01390 [Candidatus Giovannonibacteria bacterium RIFCSPLOWO2_12_43_8]
MRFVDNFLNSITMYRLAMYALFGMALFALIFSFLGLIDFTPAELMLSAAILTAACYTSNYIFARLFGAPVNTESCFISALILFFILTPAMDLNGAGILALAGIIAMASKYLIAPFRRHIFNPAAFGAAAIFLLDLGGASWWVGTSAMFPAILITGFLIVRKIRRFDLFFSFFATLLVSAFYFFGAFMEAILSWPAIFFGTIMLTEPITTPPTKKLRIIYGVLIGLFFNAAPPEFILIAGNTFSYIVGFKKKIFLTLKNKNEIAKDIFEFVFSPDKKISFAPGQYLEWTLPHDRPDSRGVRRYFTIASSPTEQEIKLGVKLSRPPSSFKKNLIELKNGQRAFAGQLAGDFTLPRDKKKKLAFIAGGIGITPFRSMIKYMVDSGERRDIALLYAVKNENKIAYRYLFIEAEAKIGLRTEYVISRLIDAALIREKLADWRERIFYISGPEAMVDAFKKMLRGMGVRRKNITTDYFPGFS